jgi:hypothetical protein
LNEAAEAADVRKNKAAIAACTPSVVNFERIMIRISGLEDWLSENLLKRYFSDS